MQEKPVHLPRLVYFSPVKYASYAQRPHCMIKAFSDIGFEVLWIDPYPTRLPVPADLKMLHSRSAPPPSSHSLFPVDPKISVIQPWAIPVEPLPLSGSLNRVLAWPAILERIRSFCAASGRCVLAIGKPSRLAEWVLRNIPHAHSFIDVLDEFPAFYRGLSRRAMKNRLHAILKKVDSVYCSSPRIMLSTYRVRPDARLIPNGYAIEDLPEPSSIEMRRCIGYVGSIASWFDWPLVRSLAQALPEVTIRLIGPELIARPENLPHNIEFTGELPQKEISGKVKEFAVGLIPFRINDLTASVDPIKFYEYRSMGIPIWTTAFGEMCQRERLPGVTVIMAGCSWRNLWHNVSTSPLDPKSVMAFRHEIDWNQRFKPVLACTFKATADISCAAISN